MNLRSNINKIHSDLLMLESVGDTVKIEERSNLDFGSHFEISATHRSVTARIIIEKADIEGYSFRWRYYSNPGDESLGLVERISTVDGFVLDLLDVFDKGRFDSDYLSQIKD